MTDKRTGPAAAAKEIMEELPIEALAEGREVWGGANPNAEIKPRSLRHIIWDERKSVETEQKIETIISKHCPQDKPVGELLKVSRRLSEWVRGLAGECLKEDVRKLLEDFEVALAEYEKVKK